MNSLKNFYARLTNQDYVYDEGNLAGVVCTNKMLDELEGIVTDSLSIQEELETLRTENARLIAERDRYKNNCVAYECNCASCKSTFLGEKEQHICFKCLLAEREAMMKQEPVARGYKNSMTGTGSELYWLGEIPEGETNLYASPLPAQQIPEGHALVPDVPNSEMISAGLDTLMRSIGRFSNYHQVVSNIWEDMLSASQKGDV